MDIRLLPGVALTAVGQQLQEADAASCRLASRQLGTATAQQQQPGSQLQVVASSFQSQLRAEKQHAQTPAAGGCSTDAEAVDVNRGGATEDADAAGVAPAPAAETQCVSAAAAAAAAEEKKALLAAACASGDSNSSGRAEAPAGEQHHDDDNMEEATAHIPQQQQEQQQQQQGGGVLQPKLTRTASSLVRAAALLGYRCVRLHVDVLQTYDEDTWQQLFSALASCPSISSVEVHEYASEQPLAMVTKEPHIRATVMELAQRLDDAANGCITPAAATRSYPRCNWLPSLVSCLHGHLQQLDMRLQAPLPAVQQPLLLQLTQLQMFSCIAAENAGRWWPDRLAVVLLPEVVVQLSQMQQLRSLAVTMGPTSSKEEDIQAVIKLQQTFSQLGSHLTHLSFGLGHNLMQLQLSAPLNSMPALQTLMCQPGFTLDAEDILYPDLDLGQPEADRNGNSDSAAAEAAAAPLVSSLTRLVLNDGYDHGPLFQLLTQPSREGLAAAASRTLLQQLEINSTGELPFELLNQLEGLRSLKFTAREKHDLTDFASRAPALTKQLHSMTLVCSQPSEQHDEWAAPYRPIPLLTALTSLNSLTIVGTPHVLLSTSEDLPLLASSLPRLQQLHFAGGFTQLRPAGRPMQLGFFGRSLQASSHPSSSSYVVLEMPSRLTALSLLCKTPVDPQECRTLRFVHGALPTSLRSLSIRGIAASIQALYSDTSSNAAGWPAVGDKSSSSSSKQQVEASAKGADVRGDEAAGNGVSSSSGVQGDQPAAAAAAESAAGGAVLPAPLPLLQRAELKVESIEDAADMIRHSSKLSDLSLELRPASITASMQDMHLAEDAAAAAAAGTPAVPFGAGLLWPQQLTSLQLGFQGILAGAHPRTYVEATADARCGLHLLLPSLCSALGCQQLRQLSLTCSNGPCMPQGAQRALSCLSSLTRLQTLQLNFACYKDGCSSSSRLAISLFDLAAAAEAGGESQQQQQQQQQHQPEAKGDGTDALACSSSSSNTCDIEEATMAADIWARVMEGLQQCSRLRQVWLGPERPIDEQQQTDLQERLPNCVVSDV